MAGTITFPRRPLPRMARVRQKLAADHIADVRGETRARLRAALNGMVRPGARIAITAGSRGIGGFAELLSGAVDAVRALGGDPFLVPSMGSHGGATAEGQEEILRRLGVADGAVGAPVRSTMETVALEAAANGATPHLNRFAMQADGIVVLGRVKTHPESAVGLASGLLKMVAVGLGSQQGAQEAHSHGLWDSVRAVPRVSMARAPILCGLAVVESGYRRPVHIEAVAPTYDAFLEADKRLLDIAQRHLARLPTDRLDLLAVDRIGKSISGTGMDLNVIGGWRLSGGDRRPDFRRIAALSLTSESLGNALGIGLADYTTCRLMDSYDAGATYINLLTATEPDSMNTREGPLPLALPSDRDALEVALYSALPDDEPRVCRIKSTAELDEFWASEALLPELREKEGCEVLSDLAAPAYDEDGNLL